MVMSAIAYSYLSWVGGKNAAQSFLRDLGWCCKEALSYKSAVNSWDGLYFRP